jgi:hypothetical protein
MNNANSSLEGIPTLSHLILITIILNTDILAANFHMPADSFSGEVSNAFIALN